MNARVGQKMQISAIFADEDGHREDGTADFVMMVRDQTTGVLRYIDANSLGAGLSATEIAFPLTVVPGKFWDLPGGFTMPTAARGLEVVCEKRHSSLADGETLPSSEKWYVGGQGDDDDDGGHGHADIETDHPSPPEA